MDQEEDALAKRRFTPGEDGTSTLVPLLVCSDDMDFNCTVLMAEQIVEGDTLRWQRFGWSVSAELEVGSCTRWIAESRSITFRLDEFRTALEGFYRLIAEDVAKAGS